MSLTGHLADPDSPVRSQFAERFPNTRELQFADADEPSTFVRTKDGDLEFRMLHHHFDPTPATVLPDDEAGYPWAPAGTACDCRLRYKFDIADPNSFAAATEATDSTLSRLLPAPDVQTLGTPSEAQHALQERRLQRTSARFYG